MSFTKLLLHADTSSHPDCLLGPFTSCSGICSIRPGFLYGSKTRAQDIACTVRLMTVLHKYSVQISLVCAKNSMHHYSMMCADQSDVKAPACFFKTRKMYTIMVLSHTKSTPR